MDVNLEPDFLRVTERAAIAAARTMGYGERKHSDKIAVEAMRKEMAEIIRYDVTAVSMNVILFAIAVLILTLTSRFGSTEGGYLSE